jgi:voltage-gated potassium channel
MEEKPKTDQTESLRQSLYRIIFEAETRAGKWFDILLIISIVLSVIVVMLDSVESINAVYGKLLFSMEWVFTVLFTIEYLLRIFCVRKPVKYVTSFFGVIDLLAILPTYLSILIPGSQYLLVIRILRVLRVFRVLKLAKFLGESDMLMQALRASRRKITIFVFTVLTLVVVLGSLMYVIESREDGFTSIPRSVYWAIVTLTTVGYGDIHPKTGLGQALAAFVMILGYGLIAVPGGIITAEAYSLKQKPSLRTCIDCGSANHDRDAVFCKYCGERL